MIFEVIFSIFFIWAAYVVVALYSGRRPKKFPPGPFTWPIFGNLLQIGVEPFKSVMKLRKKYGDIIAIDMGTKRTIFVNEYKLLREMLNLSCTNARPHFWHVAEEGTGILRGLGATSGQTWQEQRRFAFSYINSQLRDGDNQEKLVTQEIDELIDEIKKNCGVSIDTRSLCNFSTINSLWNIIAGKRYSSSDKVFSEMIKHVTKLVPQAFNATQNAALVQDIIIDNPVVLGFLVFFSTFSKMFPKLSGYTGFRKDLLSIVEFMRNIVKEYKETYVEGIQRDYIDSYLKEIKTTTDPKSSFYGATGEMNLEYNLFHLFAAGTDTVATTIHWCIFLMAHFPEEQRKLIGAIRQFKLSSGRPISLPDRERLPYVESVIQEVLRFSAIGPVGVFHEADKDFDFHGYRIPKGTMIVASQYGIMHDPEVWENPEIFNSARFLTEDGKELIRHPAFVPFGVGRRSCPGENFARDELFLFVTRLFQNFKVEFDPLRPVPQLKYVVGTALQPVDHNIVFHKLLG